jgi:hypothetical protein
VARLFSNVNSKGGGISEGRQRYGWVGGHGGGGILDLVVGGMDGGRCGF